MSEWIKYLSPVAVLTIIWGIFQFYQNRKDEKDEKRRDEKLLIYNSLYSALGSLNFKIIQFITNSRTSLILLKKEIYSINELVKNLGERITDLEHKIDALKNKSNNDPEKINELQNEWNKNKALLREITLEQVKVDNTTKHNGLSEQLIFTIKTKLEEINTLPILVIPKKMKVMNSIFSLTSQINLVLEKYNSKQHMDDAGLITLDFINLLEEVLKSSNSLQNKIGEDIK